MSDTALEFYQNMEKLICGLTKIEFLKETGMTDSAIHTNMRTDVKKFSEGNVENKTALQKRRLPHRASKFNSSLGIKRHTIVKRNQEKLKNFTNIKPHDIANFYTNKSLKGFKSTCLETIIEEPSDSNIDDKPREVNFINSRKLKRSIDLSNSTKPNKRIINKRRAKIKKTFGQRSLSKKITMEEFLKKFNSNQSLEEGEQEQ